MLSVPCDAGAQKCFTFQYEVSSLGQNKIPLILPPFLEM
jgi:hypothetical protein